MFSEQEIKLSEGEIGYIAGLVDGEGTIRIREMRHGLYYPELSIANTQKELVEWLLDKLPFGNIQKQTFEDKRPQFMGRHTIYRYAVYKLNDLEQVLILVKPFLILKRRHAELILKHIQIQRDSGWRRGLRVRSPLNEEIYLELKELNTKPSRRCKIV